jgi:hypothetical protein
MIYNLGHAVFEFMEAKWGKEGCGSTSSRCASR